MIPEGVTDIDNGTFCDCTSLTNFVIPDSVTRIGTSAFSGCVKLASIAIPDGVTSIGYNAFSGCISLTSITIPDGVTSIGDWAFENCTSLNDVYYAGSVDDWNNISIDSSNSELTSAERFHYNVTNPADHYECTVLTEPRCANLGIGEYTCPCGYSWYEVIPALGHDIVYHDGKAPSCTEPGFEAHETCTRCDYTTYVEIPATGHTYEDGVCTICGKRDPNAVILGDANGDGVVNAVDSTLISRKLSGWTVDIDSAAADVNGDGLVDAKDVTLINRKLSGWSVDF